MTMHRGLLVGNYGHENEEDNNKIHLSSWEQPAYLSF